MMKLHIPEDVVTDILISIPAHHVIKLRGVCRRWNDLILTKCFRKTHLIRSKECNSSSPVIIFWKHGDRVGQLSVIDKWEQPPERGGQIFLRGNPNLNHEIKNMKYSVDYSQDGFVVMNSRERAVPGRRLVNLIYNPVTGETVMIKSLYKFSILALFFNPWLKQYCVIVKIKKESIEYGILNLSYSPFCLRALRNLIFDCFCSSPVVINNEYIYWKVETSQPSWCRSLILAFNVKEEKFSFLAHPNPYYVNDCTMYKHKNMHIVNIHDNLRFIHQEFPVVDYLVFNIWTMHSTKKHKRKWIKIQKVTIDVHNIDVHKFKVDRGVFDPYLGICQVMAAENGELLLGHCFGGVIAYNFESGTVRNIAVYSLSAKFSMYVSSFASISNCESRSSKFCLY